jgi:hypothetical protein
MKRRSLTDLLPIRRPSDYLHEALKCCALDDHTPEGQLVTKGYQLTFRLYRGQLDGYLPCDTNYHDFAHAAETFLCMARLVHGAFLANEKMAEREVAVGLTAAIMHDTGYIRTIAEADTTGAQCRGEHELRSMDFATAHAKGFELTDVELADARAIIRGTILAEDVNAMRFRSRSQELLGRMLSVSDLLSQLSSDIYLERLIFLHEEDKQSGEPHYTSRKDCCRKAIEFDARARTRLKSHLEPLDDYLTRHFSARCNRPANLYRVSMDRQVQYLAKAIEQNGFDPHRHLRRWGSVRKNQNLFDCNDALRS